MQIRDAMTRGVRTIAPTATLREAAQIMCEIDAGSLPVAEDDRLVGMITDRDIAVRAVAQGKGPGASVREAMSHDIKYCFDDDDMDDVAENMGELQVRRLPVVTRDKRLVGIVSLGDIACASEGPDAGEALELISRPGGAHNQSSETTPS
jgi:CBS domain-containing protein